jgi:adenylate cyclase, class 2
MSGSIEREIKLRFGTVDEARIAVRRAGATLTRERRLQSDAILDTENAQLQGRRSALRIRVEPGRCYLTYKGPPQPSMMKLREELETSVGDAALIFALFERLGFRVWFRYEKYREEFALGDAQIAVDETPVGVFVEIEGSDAGIAATAAMFGRGPGDYVADSYRALYLQQCESRGVTPGDMVFPD